MPCYMFAFVDALDFLLSEEQKIKKETRKIANENRILEAKVDLKDEKAKREKLKKQLSDEQAASS